MTKAPTPTPEPDAQDTMTNANTPSQKDGDYSEADRDVYELFRAMFYAALLALVIRTFLFEPFNIPSESMVPNLLVGDYLFVSKYSYGYGQYSFPMNIAKFDGRIMDGDMPQRGDVAVFRLPKNPSIDYIKRIIGLPGDEVQVIGGRLYINGAEVARQPNGTQDCSENGDNDLICTRYVETLPNGVRHDIIEISDRERLDDTPPFIVPDDHYFAMGDNRDSSQDSRVMEQVGFVPAENLVGRAEFIFFSMKPLKGACARTGSFRYPAELLCTLVTIPKNIRYDRIFDGIH